MNTITRRPSKKEYVGSNNKKQENSNKEAFTSSFVNTDSNKKLEKSSDVNNVKNSRFNCTEKTNLKVTNNLNNSGNINVRIIVWFIREVFFEWTVIDLFL